MKDVIKEIKKIVCEEVYYGGETSSQALNVVCPTFIEKIMTSKKVHAFYRQERETNFKGYKKRKCVKCGKIDKLVASL